MVTTVRARTLFAPLEAGSRAESVARQLERAIRLGLLLDGERLPAESDLAGQLGVSTETLRDALASLRDVGLVETRRGRGGGSFVRTPSGHGELERPANHQVGRDGADRAAAAQPDAAAGQAGFSRLAAISRSAALATACDGPPGPKIWLEI